MLIAIAASFLTLAYTTQQQTPDFAEAIRANSDAAQAYTHKRRTQVTLKGNTRTKVDQIRYVDGTMQATPVEGGDQRQQASRGGRRGGPMMRKRVEKKVKEAREDAQELMALLQKYLHPGPALLEKGKIERTETSAKVVAQGLVKPKDTFELSWNTAAKQPDSMSIRTDLDGDPVTINVKFAKLPDDGPFYAANTTIARPKKDLTIRVENFDYVK
jgi:hypothetical protein